eukprot:COSAG01_NODE_1687_length_9495_cov_2.856003_14_plen_56_part_00
MRIRKANADAVGSMTLGQRTDGALDTLQTSSQLPVIIGACVSLGELCHFSNSGLS